VQINSKYQIPKPKLQSLARKINSKLKIQKKGSIELNFLVVLCILRALVVYRKQHGKLFKTRNIEPETFSSLNEQH
jgi:hypothetical protein